MIAATFNPIPHAEAAACMREEEDVAAYTAAYVSLRDAMIDALLKDPTRVVHTPAYKHMPVRARYTAAYEAMANMTDSVALDLCKLLAACDQANMPLAQKLAQSIVVRIAHEYAETHAGAAS